MMHVLSDSRMQIMEAIKRRGAATIDELVEVVELSKTAVRAHLLTLEERDFIERTEVEVERTGRPPLAFRITEKGCALFPSHDAEILAGLLSFLKERGLDDVVEAFFERQWQARRAEFELELEARQCPKRDISARLAALEAVLDRTGFMPDIAASAECDGSAPLVIMECNCPMPAVVRATRIPCKLESEFLAHAVGCKPERVTLATTHHGRCAFEFDVEPTDEEE